MAGRSPATEFDSDWGTTFQKFRGESLYRRGNGVVGIGHSVCGDQSLTGEPNITTTGKNPVSSPLTHNTGRARFLTLLLAKKVVRVSESDKVI